MYASVIELVTVSILTEPLIRGDPYRIYGDTQRENTARTVNISHAGVLLSVFTADFGLRQRITFPICGTDSVKRPLRIIQTN